MSDAQNGGAAFPTNDLTAIRAQMEALAGFTKEYLGELLSYDADTGVLLWKPRPQSAFKSQRDARAWNTRYAGKPAGTVDGQGYISVRVNGRRQLAHRVVWLLIHGEIPEQIDHVNGVRSDNRILNLRNVTVSENGRNMKKMSTNTSGVMGVEWHKRSKKWRASINVIGRRKYLGCYNSFDDAVASRKRAEIDYNYHPNHGRARAALGQEGDA